MGRPATGSIYFSRERWYVVFSIGEKRTHFALSVGASEDETKARRGVMAQVLLRLRRTGVDLTIVNALLKELAAATPAQLPKVMLLVDGVLSGREQAATRVAPPSAPTLPRVAQDITFAEFGRLWTSGKLHTMFPAHVKSIDQEDNAQRFEKHVYPVVGKVRMRDFTLDHADLVLSQGTLPRGSVRHSALIIHRLVVLAVYPGRILPATPLPRGWLPRPARQKAMSFLYPEEDAMLLRTTRVPLIMRLLVGMSVREGLRKDEAASLEWKNLDLARGTIDLDENKTDDPRTWALDAGTAEALRRWQQTCPSTVWVFPAEGLVGARRRNTCLAVGALARQLRVYLREAGVRRDVLFESDATRQRLRAHDLRASFITVHLALGKSETWIQDRTGHRSSVMINRYRRRARLAEQLQLGPFEPLHVAIPELRDAPVGPPKKEQVSAERLRRVNDRRYCRAMESARIVGMRQELRDAVFILEGGRRRRGAELLGDVISAQEFEYALKEHAPEIELTCPECRATARHRRGAQLEPQRRGRPNFYADHRRGCSVASQRGDGWDNEREAVHYVLVTSEEASRSLADDARDGERRRLLNIGLAELLATARAPINPRDVITYDRTTSRVCEFAVAVADLGPIDVNAVRAVWGPITSKNRGQKGDFVNLANVAVLVAHEVLKANPTLFRDAIQHPCLVLGTVERGRAGYFVRLNDAGLVHVARPPPADERAPELQMPPSIVHSTPAGCEPQLAAAAPPNAQPERGEEAWATKGSNESVVGQPSLPTTRKHPTYAIRGLVAWLRERWAQLAALLKS